MPPRRSLLMLRHAFDLIGQLDSGRAIRDLERALIELTEDNPNGPETAIAHLALGLLLHAQGDLDRSRHYLLEALRIREILEHSPDMRRYTQLMRRLHIADDRRNSAGILELPTDGSSVVDLIKRKLSIIEQQVTNLATEGRTSDQWSFREPDLRELDTGLEQDTALLPDENLNLKEELLNVMGEEWLTTKNVLLNGFAPQELLGTRHEFILRDILRSVMVAALS